jgi:D-serine deaminase-like pyridoxal phosphate-dependent protein
VAGPWSAVLAGRSLPACFVDLDAMQANRATLEAALPDGGPRLRLSTAAIRSSGLLRHLLTAPGHRLQGLLCTSVAEAELLIELGFDDVVISAPACSADEAERVAQLVAAGHLVVPTVDDFDQVALLAAAAAGRAGPAGGALSIGVCVDVDVSWQPAAELWFGLRRSPLRDSEQARALAARIGEADGVHVLGVSAWAAQAARPLPTGAAGVLRAPLRGVVRSRSAELAADRRAATVEALKGDGHAVAVVLGGSTGDLAGALRDPTLTDLPVGEGLLCPVRCDRYGLNLKPAIHFALPVVRRPDAEHITCRGGGYPSAGPDPAWPVPVWPPGLRVVAEEGWGQSHTAFSVAPGAAPPIGGAVVCRPARSGDLLDRFNEVLLYQGDQLVEVLPTWRGLGLPTG